MGKRRRTEIEKIEDRKKLNVTFTKRRQGLFKKAKELSILCNSQIALLVFSSSGKPYVYGDLQNLTNRYYSNSHNFNTIPLSSSDDDVVVDDEHQTNNNNNNCTITTTESAIEEEEEKDEEMNFIAMEEEKEKEEEEKDDDDDDEIWYWEDANTMVVTEEDRERSEAEKEELSIHDFAISNGFDFDISNGEEEEDISVHDFDTSSGFDFGISNREEENYCTGDHDGYLYSSSSHPWQDEIAALLSAELPPPLCY
uniref:MADS-box protein AGL66 n=1 Tax=Aquilegia coerulea TaxID=218851 RepID=K7XWM9_AQUCA|nr:MADS-box protein AGL66 [Aquilegia coerulea]